MPADAAALEIRLARSADLDRMLEAWLALTRYHARFERLFELRPGAEVEVRELLRAQLRDPDAAAWLVLDDPQLVGYAAVRVDRAPAIHQERMRAEITALWVPARWRRRGVGCKLAARALEWARERGAERVEVRVAPRNSSGRGFWAAQGFGDFMDVLQRPL